MITKTREAVEIMEGLLKQHEYVGVGVTPIGWKGQQIKYSIIADGRACDPIDEMTEGVYNILRSQGFLGANVLIATDKARRTHPFVGSLDYGTPEKATFLPEPRIINLN